MDLDQGQPAVSARAGEAGLLCCLGPRPIVATCSGTGVRVGTMGSGVKVGLAVAVDSATKIFPWQAASRVMAKILKTRNVRPNLLLHLVTIAT